MLLTVIIPALAMAAITTVRGYGQQEQRPSPLPAYNRPQVEHVQQYQAQMNGAQSYPRPSVMPSYQHRPRPSQPSSYGGQVPGYGGNGQGSFQRPSYGGQTHVPVYGGMLGSGQLGGPQYPILVPQQALCPFDEECFKASPECTISNAYPFERRTPFNCTECLNLCLEKQFGDYPYICKSAVYDSQSKTCDIFAVDGLNSPQNYLKYPGRSIYRPTGACQTAVRPAEGESTLEPEKEALAPATGFCSKGSVAKISEIVGYSRQLEGAKLEDHTAGECATACLTNQDKNGAPLELNGESCHTSTYSKRDGCQVSQEIVNMVDMGPEEEVTTFKVICVQEELISDCPGNFYYSPHHVLVGFAKQVVTAMDETDCIMQCLNSLESTGFSCISGMFYFSETEENCILNTEDRKTQPQVYTEDEDQVVYFELGCLKRRMRKSKLKILKDAPEQNDWTEWSSCKSAEEDQVRFKLCGKKDVRDCQSQRRKCKIVRGDKPRSTKRQSVQ